MRFVNTNTKPRDYYQIRKIPRPGHADLTTKQKFDGFNDYRGGGASSGRLTLGLVAAGVIANKILTDVEINAKIIEIGGSKDYEPLLDTAIEEGDSLGGIIECRITNLPSGLGEPFFDSVESYISHLAFAVPAVKGIEFGVGFGVAKLKGSQINDSILDQKGTTKSNNSGGINGGISNGNDIIFRVAVKAPSSISKEQQSLNIDSGAIEKFEIHGRHDVCIALRFPVIVESIAAIALADLHLIRRTNNV
jgi:chorismate synthase